MTKRDPEPFVPPVLTRTVAAVLLATGIFLVYIAVTNYGALGVWPALLIGAGGASMSMLALTAIITADPSWIMLDLILPR